MDIWYILSLFGILHQEKSGNPGKAENKNAVQLANHHLDEGRI
jgi:hypothetical protein